MTHSEDTLHKFKLFQLAAKLLGYQQLPVTTLSVQFAKPNRLITISASSLLN